MSKRAFIETIDWTKCIICQKYSGEYLECPAKSKRNTVEDYQTFETAINELVSCISAEELGIKISSLDEGGGIACTLTHHAAVWHKSCRALYSKRKLQRVNEKCSALTSTECDQQDEEVVENKVKESCRRLSTRAVTSLPIVEVNKSKCFFCEKEADNKNKLHNVLTLQVSDKVQRFAERTADAALIAKFMDGDMVAQGAHYHRNCFLALCNRTREKHEREEKEHEASQLENTVFAEIVSYLEEGLSEADLKVYKLSEIGKMYTRRLEAYGISRSKRAHTTRLKERLLQQLPNLRESATGRDVLLYFEDNISDILNTALGEKRDNDVVNIMRTAKLIRRDLANHHTSQFEGSFEAKSETIPHTLLTLMKTILVGSVGDDVNARHNESVTLSQLIMFNSIDRARPADKDSGDKPKRYNTRRETPTPLYIGLKVHALTRSKDLVNMLYNLGICISYRRVINLSTDIANSVCSQFEREGVVCPISLKKNVFTTAAIDNLDHNPSSTTAQGSFHGTGMSLFQHPSKKNDGITRGHFPILHTSKEVKKLPYDFLDIKQVPTNVIKHRVPNLLLADSMSFESQSPGLISEYKWLKHMHTELQSGHNGLTFSAFNASLVEPVPLIKSHVSMLPLLLDNAHNMATVKHCMDVIKKAINHLNPTQAPVITVDQPLFAIAKHIQWTWPAEYGEDKFVIVLGGLHVEMALLKMIGTILDGSGWKEAISKAGLCGPGTAESMLKVTHLMRSRHSHEVTAAALYCLQQEAYLQAMDDGVIDERKSFETWQAESKDRNSLFFYWTLVLETELTIFKYIRSIREGNFDLYVNSLCELAPLLFATDHTHYSRWLPIHIRDMRAMESMHPTIFAEFLQGHFTVTKTSNPFSCIALDQAHEQNNDYIKGDGGFIGLTENPSALRRWMLAGAETFRILQEFEDLYMTSSDSGQYLHHDQYAGKQKKFQHEVLALIDVFNEHGNPFSQTSNRDLVNIFNNVVFDEHVSSNINNLKQAGMQQFNQYVDERIKTQTKNSNERIKTNRFQLLARKNQPNFSRAKLQLQETKADCNLFSRLYIACQSRGADLDDFFFHENHAYPPSLAIDGRIRNGEGKSDLLKCLLDQVPTREVMPGITCMVFDGAAIVHMLSPKSGSTFGQYAQEIVIPFIRGYTASVDRIDVVFDRYFQHSLKGTTRQKRGVGIRRRVHATAKVPRDWKDFLKNNENKTDLFRYLAQQMLDGITEIIIMTTLDDTVISNQPDIFPTISPCQQEEADTRMILHVLHASENCHNKIMIRTVDTDVVVLSAAHFQQLILEELWIAFGVGKHFKYIPVHEIATTLTPEKCMPLLFFHAFSGSDCTSSFLGIGKKTAWSAWNSFPEITPVFHKLSGFPTDVQDDDISSIEKFTIRMYDKSNTTSCINTFRKDLFIRKGRTIDRIPPTRHALTQHIKRSAFIAGHVWRSSISCTGSTQRPTDWGWTAKEGSLLPVWTTLPEILRRAKS